MTSLMPVLAALVKDEVAGVRPIDLGTVTAVYTDADGGGATNLAVDLRLRGSALELQHVPISIGRLGVSVAPRVGDLAVVGFVSGDLNAGVVLGFLYDEQIRPPQADPEEIVYVVPDDAKDGARRLSVQLPNNNSVELQDSKLTVTMGSTTVTIEADGDVTIEAGGGITLKAQGDLALSAGGSISVDASGDFTAKGMNVTVQGQAAATLKGAQTTVAGVTNFSPS
jgi:phage baseplate assembly protein gpV